MPLRQIFLRIGVPVLGVALVAMAYRWYGWTGVAAIGTGLVMWALLHVHRLMHVLKRAANQPIGFVPSSVMLNARLQAGMTLLHVVAMTKSLGELQSPPDQQPELFRWTDDSDSHVTCEFLNGRLVKWALFRPVPDNGTP